MESEESSRPSISFPLGLALLLVLLVFMCGSFAYYLLWDKFTSFFRHSIQQTPHSSIEDLQKSATHPRQEIKKKEAESLPVLMPGDKVPKFIAMASPREPPVIEKLIVTVQKLPSCSLPFDNN